MFVFKKVPNTLQSPSVLNMKKNTKDIFHSVHVMKVKSRDLACKMANGQQLSPKKFKKFFTTRITIILWLFHVRSEVVKLGAQNFHH